LKYRPEIDGLRAVAVLPVIFFHAGVGIFSGGYVGVDVFFVISGYLITSILLDELSRNDFSLMRFYERRARRILPALFFVMACCIPFAWMWMLPSQFKAFSQSLIATTLFVSNIFFWRQSGYFAPAAEEMPLLHTWSLAVEEQYYLFFPLLLLVAWRLGRTPAFFLVAATALASFAISEWGSRFAPAANFYLAPSRAWELLAGSLCAFALQSRTDASVSADAGPKAFHHEILSIVGLGLIVSAIFLFDHTTPFPSIYTLVPVGGAVLVILFATPGTLVTRVLSIRLFVGIGLISYSAYLWHQPLFAFARIRSLTTPEPWLMLALAALALGLAYFSWRFVEQPFRRRAGIGGHSQFRSTFALALGFPLLIGFGASGIVANGFKNRHAIPDSIYASMARSSREKECFDIERAHDARRWSCDLGSSSKKTFLVFGDSHSLNVLPAADEIAGELRIGGLFVGASSCLPFLGIYSLRADQEERNCHALNERVYRYVSESGIRLVLLVARWTYYTEGGYDGKDFSFVANSPASKKSPEESRSAFARGLSRTIEQYARIGVKLAVVAQVPQQIFDPMKVYFLVSRNSTSPRELSVPTKKHLLLQKNVLDLFFRVGILVLSFDRIFCDAEICAIGTNRESYYYDDDHLSVVGSGLVRKELQDFIARSLSLDN
jgi:peptidoglycan/LPS O-acetylase OafA/YrhL